MQKDNGARSFKFQEKNNFKTRILCSANNDSRVKKGKETLFTHARTQTVHPPRIYSETITKQCASVKEEKTSRGTNKGTCLLRSGLCLQNSYVNVPTRAPYPGT